VNEFLYDARWIGNHGIGRFADELKRRLSGLHPFHAERRPWHPLDPVLLGATLWSKRAQLYFSPGYNSPLGWPGQFVFTLHDLHHLRVPDNSSALKRAYYQTVIKPACHRATFVLTVSEYSRGEIATWARMADEKIINVGNGVGKPFTPMGPRYEPGYPYLLYVGSRKPHKNLWRLLQAYSASGVAHEVRLILSGLPDSKTMQRVNELRLGRSIVFLSMDSTKALAEVYRGAAAFLFPSLYEGFGLPPLEAMSCGVPVITSNVCSLPEVVGNAALLVNPVDVEELANGIRRIVMDSGLRETLRARGWQRARRFSWEDTAQRTASVLTAVAGPRTVGVQDDFSARRNEALLG